MESNIPNRHTATATEKPKLCCVTATKSFCVRRSPRTSASLPKLHSHREASTEHVFWEGPRSASGKLYLRRSHSAVMEFLNVKKQHCSGLHRKWIQSPGQGHEWMAFRSSPYFNGTIGNSCMFCMSFYLIFLFTCIFPAVQSQQRFWELWLQHPLFQQLSD